MVVQILLNPCCTLQHIILHLSLPFTATMSLLLTLSALNSHSLSVTVHVRTHKFVTTPWCSHLSRPGVSCLWRSAGRSPSLHAASPCHLYRPVNKSSAETHPWHSRAVKGNQTIRNHPVLHQIWQFKPREWSLPCCHGYGLFHITKFWWQNEQSIGWEEMFHRTWTQI